MWEISELKKPHSDLDESEMHDIIKKRIKKGYLEPLSNDVPDEWEWVVTRGN